jgi:hypothetical protein
MGLFKNFDRNKWLYNGLIVTFIILYAVTAFVSFYHAITFFNIANAVWLSVLLSFVAEIGQASVLFGILLSENKNKFLSWFVMIILTSLQVIGNVVSSFDWIINHNDVGLAGFQRSILFWVQTGGDQETFRVIVAWISGALLPVIALSMTALVAQNINLRDEEKKRPKKDAELPSGYTISQEPVVDARDIISEVSKIRPTQEDLENLSRILEKKVPINEVPKEEDELNKHKELLGTTGVPDADYYNDAVKEEPEESHEPDDDELSPVDLTNEEPDKILQKDIEIITETASHLTDNSKKIEFDELDEEVERLSPEFIISTKNGLVDGIIGTNGHSDPPVIRKEEEKIPQDTEQVIEQPPNPSPTPFSSNDHITSDQLERIRQIARDNLKKK